MQKAVLGVLLSLAVSLGLVQVVKIEPVKASWSGWMHRLPPYNYVAQGITCNFDEPIYAEYFTGTATGQQYQVQLQFPGLGGLVVAHVCADAADAAELLDRWAGRPRMA